MKKYQLVESFGNHKHAGSKATNDAVEILTELGFKSLYFEKVEHDGSISSKIKRHISMYKNWKEIYSKVESGSVLLLQHPFYTKDYYRFSTLKKLKTKKNVKIISLVHDVEPIRKMFNKKHLHQEFAEMLEVADKLIIHNEVMKKWFIDYGVSEDKLITLEIFDYLGQGQENKNVEFSKRIQIAGNLDKTKSPYIYELEKISKVEFDLFGINYDDEKKSNVTYHGSFSPEEVMNQLKTGFGLVWDGDSINTCRGITGNYLRYNNPHKLSLYLASSLPVVVWSESAEANFVEENKVGITVSSIGELEGKLNNISQDDYETLLENVNRVRVNLEKGNYLKKAIEEALH